jgi:hypothetical protein
MMAPGSIREGSIRQPFPYLYVSDFFMWHRNGGVGGHAPTHSSLL